MKFNSLVYSYIFRALIVGINFILVPLTIEFLGKENYGLWVTILSIVGWFSLADFGCFNSIRNYITKGFYDNNSNLDAIVRIAFIRVFKVSIIIFIIMILFLLFFREKSPFRSEEVNIGFLTIFFLLSNLPFSISINILHSISQTRLVYFIQLLSALLFYVLILVTKYVVHENNIYFISLYYGVCLYFISFVSWVFLINKFGFKNPLLFFYENNNPNLFRVNGFHGAAFSLFVIQLSLLVILNTDNIIVAKLFSLSMVSEYYAYDKLYYIYNLIFTIVLTPIWACVNSLISKSDDNNELKRLVNKLLKFFGFSFLLVISIYQFSSEMLEMWTKIKFELIEDNRVNFSFALFSVLLAWNGIFSTIMNGIGKIRSQLYCYLFAALLNIPLSIYFSNGLSLGVSGVKFASALCILPSAIILPFQVYRFLCHEKNVIKRNS